MGACCSTKFHIGTIPAENDTDDSNDHHHDVQNSDNDVVIADHGARKRIRGSSAYVSMYSQQGRKGVNQDAMTVWEEFTGEKDTFFCGVFDGHGPYGHKVSRHVRNTLPSRLSSSFRSAQSKVNPSSHHDCEQEQFSSWERSLVECFEDMDEELSVDASIDSFCSGSTAVTIVKKGNYLIIANLGDSRALLCSRGPNNQLVPVQLTTDMKPNIASEAERIKQRKGRVFALAEDPEKYRLWMPDEDCPGLAMARAFGDFCLKEYGLISVPEVSCRKLTNNDEFVVLATDGVWDVLSNSDVVKIVASVRERPLAAKILVKIAVQAWRAKYPGSKVDDCAVVCLYLKKRTVFARSFSEVSRVTINHSELAEGYSEISRASLNRSEIAALPPNSLRKHVKDE